MEKIPASTLVTENPHDTTSLGNKSSILDLFPFKPSLEQRNCLNSFEQESHVLWNAPTGFGKSIVALTSMSYHLFGPNPTLKRIVMFVRTKTQIFHILNEIATLTVHLTKYKKKLNPRVEENSSIFRFPLIGKEDLCVFTEPIQGKSIHCKSLGCKYYHVKLPSEEKLQQVIIRNDFFSQCKSSTDIKQLVKDLFPKYCPYYIIRQALKFSQIIVTTHAWLMSPTLRKMFFREYDLKSTTTGIIIDEVHNFRATETATLKQSHVRNMLTFCEWNNYPPKAFLKDFNKLFDIDSQTTVPTRLLPRSWILDQLVFYQRKFFKEVLPIRGITAKEYQYFQSLNEGIKFLLTEGDGFYINQTESSDEKVLTKILSFPEMILRHIYDFQRVILMSGTLHPPEAYLKLFNIIEQFKLIITPPSPQKVFVCTYFIPGLSSRFQDRNMASLAYQTQIINELHKLNSMHTMIFSPSEKYSSNLFKIYEKQFTSNKIVHQGASSKENEKLLKELREQDNKIIFATLRGRLSEGIEIIDNKTRTSKIRMIVVTGVPIPPPTNYQTLLEHKYSKRWGSKEAVLFLRWMPAYQLLLQAVGRGIRHPSDHCAIICLDNRIPQLNIFPEQLLYITNNWEHLMVKIANFYRNQVKFDGQN